MPSCKKITKEKKMKRNLSKIVLFSLTIALFLCCGFPALADVPSPCTQCIIDFRPDILPFYERNGWDISPENQDNIIDNWCGIDPEGCSAAKESCDAYCDLENYCAGRGNGWYCDGGSLVKCVDGNEASRTACAHGCYSSPPGEPDFCEDPYHITQVTSPTFNPNGCSEKCKSCGPTSLAMALRKNYYSGSNNLTDPKDEISHARSLLYGSGQCRKYSIKNVQGTTHNIKYRLLDCDGYLTDVAAKAGRAMSFVGGFKENVGSKFEMDYYLNNNAPVILLGYLDDEWANVFDPQGHWGYGGGVDHYIAVLGKENGLYIVNDPLYKYGRQLMTYTRLSEFLDYGFTGAVAIYLSRSGLDPCSLYDGNLQLCDEHGYGAQQDCGFYICSGKCRARGTHNCDAGCDEDCSSAPATNLKRDTFRHFGPMVISQSSEI